MLPVHIIPFLYKNGEKNTRFCAFTLIPLMTNTEPKISLFVRSHCSGSVKLIVEYCSVFKNLRFFGYPLSIAFSKHPFFGVFVKINVNTFTKTEVFLSVFVQKRCSVNGALACWVIFVLNFYRCFSSFETALTIPAFDFSFRLLS